MSVDLKWAAPKSDNGAPIQRYIIEKKNRKFGDWEKAAEVNIHTLGKNAPGFVVATYDFI